MAQRVAIFLDYQNVHLVGRGVFGKGCEPHRCVPNPVRLAELVASRRARECELADIRVYRGRPDPDRQPVLTAANDSQAASWSRDARVTVVRRQLNYRGWPDLQPQEKGIDVALAVDMMRMAIRAEHDTLLLFSSDTDLLPALEAIRELPRRHVEVACWSKSRPLRFPGTNLPYCHFLSKGDWEAVVEDWEGR